MMSRVVFIDASGWIAIANKRDHHHLTAVRLYKQLLQQGFRLITSTWTAYEALSLIKTRLGLDAALKLWEILNNRNIVSLIKVSAKIEAEGLKMFFGYTDKKWGITDCTSIALMLLLGCRQAVAFDEHFVEAGKQNGFVILK